MGIDNILIADDDFAFVNRLKNGLQQFGQFMILTAPDGRHAVRLLTNRKVSLVVMDLEMPKMDGLELLAVMSRKFPNVLSIVMTSLQRGELKKRSTGDSLFSYLNKPFDHISLHNEIIRALDCRDELHFKAGIYPSSLLPLVHIVRKTCRLEIQAESGKTGTLFFRNGMVEHASCGNLKGFRALEEMLKWQPCKYRFGELPRLHTRLLNSIELTAKIMEGMGLKVAVPERREKRAAKPRSKSAPVRHRQLPETVQPQTVHKHATPPRSSDSCKVLIVDASAIMRNALKKVLATDPGIAVAGEAGNGREALELIKRTKPDVVILDTQLPVMAGLTVLKYMMIQSPTPTIMFSAVTLEGAAITFDMLKYGAIDFMAKPPNIINPDMGSGLKTIIHRIHLAAEVKIETAKYIRTISADKKAAAAKVTECKRVVCIGAAEGGYAALLKIIPKLSPDLPVAHFVVLNVIPQHVDAFITYLDRHSIIRIARAENGLPVEGATCYFASGREYVNITADKSGGLTMLVKPAPLGTTEGKPINTLMFSVAQEFKEKTIGVVLSGSGDDGTEGLKEIKRVGGRTIIQNPYCSLYKEMVESARRHIGKKTIFTDSKIAETVNKICLQDL